MKQIFTLFVLVFVWQDNLPAQESGRPRHIKKIWITELGSPAKIHGILSEVKDSSLVIYTGHEKMTSKSMSYGHQDIEIPYTKINTIKTRKKSSRLKGVVYTTLSGMLVGAAIGYSGGDDPPGWFSWTAGDKAAIGAFVGTVLGAPVGFVLGSLKKGIPINGEYTNFKNSRSDLMK